MAKSKIQRTREKRVAFVVIGVFTILFLWFTSSSNTDENNSSTTTQSTTISALKNYYSGQAFDSVSYFGVEQNIRSITAVFHMPIFELITYDEMARGDKVDIAHLICPLKNERVWQTLNENYKIVLKFTNPDSNRRVLVTCPRP